MTDEKKSSKGSIIVIVILTILVIGLVGYIGYDKFLNTNNNSTEENSTNKVDDKDVVENTEDNSNKEGNANDNSYIKTRSCIGVYSGSAALTQDAQTGEYGMGTLTIELKADGTYELKKENINGDSGEYTIIDNVLLLKTSPDTCDSTIDCSASYSEYLSISEDCSKISWGYGSYFFNPDFTLTKQN